MTSSVYVTRDGVFLDISQNGDGTTIQVYNSFFPQLGNSIIFNGTLSHDMKLEMIIMIYKSKKRKCTILV
jgi:hypothetical protein